MRTGLLILLWTCALTAAAQERAPACSEVFRASRGTAPAYVIGSDTTGYWLHERTGDKTPGMTLTRLDAQLRTLWRKAVQLPEPEGVTGAEIEQVLLIQGHFYVFTVSRQSDPEGYQAHVTVLDREAAVVMGPALIHYVDDTWKSGRPRFVVRVSRDENRILVLFESPFERKASESIALKVFDPALDMVWERTLDLPYEQDVVQVHQYEVDNAGGVYLMSGENPEKHALTWQRPQGRRYVVFYYDYPTNVLREYDVSLRDKQVLSVQFDLNAANELVIAGFYSNDFQFAAAGTFLFILNAAAEGVRVASYMAFPPELIAQYLTERQAGRNPGLPDFYLDHLVLRDDGTFWLVGEQFAISENLMVDPMTGRQLIERRFTYDDLLAVQLNAEARITKSVRIAKRQFDTSQNPNLSYTLHVQPDRLVFHFNDHPESTERLAQKPDASPAAWNGSRGAAVTRVTVNEAGEVTRIGLIGPKTEEGLLRPSLIRHVQPGVPLLGLEGPKGYRFCLYP
jgi:hypothetical protein